MPPPAPLPIPSHTQGNRNRTTHATEVNDVSSRSHAICQIVLRHRESGRMHGKLSLVDLAGACSLSLSLSLCVYVCVCCTSDVPAGR